MQWLRNWWKAVNTPLEFDMRYVVGCACTTECESCVSYKEQAGAGAAVGGSSGSAPAAISAGLSPNPWTVGLSNDELATRMRVWAGNRRSWLKETGQADWFKSADLLDEAANRLSTQVRKPG